MENGLIDCHIMDLIIYLHTLMDSILMPFFRFSQIPAAGYLLGITILSIISVLVGEVSIYLAFRFNKDNIDQTSKDMEHYQQLSLKALQSENRIAYKACNSIANENFGKSFFMQITLAAASLWPLLIALGWMQHRFDAVNFSNQFSFPGSEYVFGYFTTFIFCYMLVRLVFVKIKRLVLPYSV